MKENYSPCRTKTCRSTEVIREVLTEIDDTHEFIIISCKGCDRIRAKYRRLTSSEKVKKDKRLKTNGGSNFLQNRKKVA